MVSGATDDATTRLVLGEISYDHFLAECSQAVTVDVPATAKALSKLIVDSKLRARMGRAGRQRAMTQFDWQHVIREYERVWSEQEQQRAAAAADAQPAKTATPTLYPSPEHTFTGYPTQWLADADLLEAAPDARQCLADLLTTPLTNHFAQRRFSDHDSLYQILASQSGAVSVSAWLSEIERLGSTPQEARRTLARLLKYDLLRHHAPDT